MAKYKATIKYTGMANGQYVETGMNVEFYWYTDPWMDGGKPINDAFIRLHGVDVKKNFSMGYVEVKEVR